MKSATSQWVLAIAPGTRRLGYALFEGEDLIRFGVRTFDGKKNQLTFVPQVTQYLEALLASHAPNVLGVEDMYYAQGKMSPRLRALITEVKRWARRKGVRTTSYLPTEVREHFCNG